MSEYIRKTFKEKSELHDRSTNFFLDQCNQCEAEDKEFYYEHVMRNHKYFLDIFTQLADAYVEGSARLEFDFDCKLYNSILDKVGNLRSILCAAGVSYD